MSTAEGMSLHASGWIPTPNGPAVPAHLVQSGRSLLAEVLDLSTVVYGIASRIRAQEEALAALITDDDPGLDQLGDLLEASLASATQGAFQSMADWVLAGQLHGLDTTPDDLRERYGRWAAAPYGPAAD